MNSAKNPKLLIVEDDAEQMDLLTAYALSEVEKLVVHENTTEQKKQALQSIDILRATNVQSLKKALSSKANIFLAILDCNLPDAKGESAHDQLIKTNYRITGQHKPIDLVIEYSPHTPITMISSFNRFKSLLNQYYENKHDLSINFIRKNDQSMIKRNIGHYLRQYLKEVS